MNEQIIKYIEQKIFPKYNKYYAHGMLHINNVIKNCLKMAEYYNLDKNMCYVMASFHDVGLNIDRENHEIESGKILYSDKELKKYFTSSQIRIMKEAIEDHRGSKKDKPRSIYGEVLSDADRDFNIEILAKRQLATSLKNYPNLKSFDEHFERCYKYILSRINSKGHFNLWTNNPELVKQRLNFEKEFLDKENARNVYKKEYDKISNDGTLERIINYYEDY